MPCIIWNQEQEYDTRLLEDNEQAWRAWSPIAQGTELLRRKLIESFNRIIEISVFFLLPFLLGCGVSVRSSLCRV